jgi:Histone methylation protein DOT1
MMGALRSLVEELEQDRSLHEPDGLCHRVAALDRLEAYLLNVQIDAAQLPVYRRAKALNDQLESANFELYRTIRSEIQRGARPGILLERVRRSGHAHGQGYDFLDELVVGVLQFEEPGGEGVPSEAEMVFYQPTPARHIFDLIGRTALTERDVLMDLGSGLGHVPLVASICTGARSIGLERESAYIDCARQSAQGLNLNNITFLHQDARTADLSLGTVFYLYTPFSGTILRTVLDSLRREAARRQIRICTFGPCTPTIAQERWLEATGPLDADHIAVFSSRMR